MENSAPTLSDLASVSAVNEVSDSAKPKKKRPCEEASASASFSVKQAKKEMEADTETKKAYFQRICSEEDEIVILQGMINFKSETGKNPTIKDMSELYESVKNYITYEAKNLSLFIRKIHSLKKKFMAKMKKGDKLSFAKAYDVNCFELSELIWRADLESKKKIKVESLEPEGEDVEGNWFENSFLFSSIVSFGMDEETVKKKWSLVPMEVKKKIQEKWKVLNGKNLEFVLEKIALVREVVYVLP